MRKVLLGIVSFESVLPPALAQHFLKQDAQGKILSEKHYSKDISSATKYIKENEKSFDGLGSKLDRYSRVQKTKIWTGNRGYLWVTGELTRSQREQLDTIGKLIRTILKEEE